MIESHDLIRRLAVLLEEASLNPVLIGGAALVHHGSDRVTKDFDIVIRSKLDAERLITIVYDAGFRLITKFHQDRTVRRFIEEAPIASIRLREEVPDALFFYHPVRELRLDILFDFPIPAAELHARAETVVEEGTSWKIACRDDLRRMKEMAYRDRGAPRDAMDLLFLGVTEEELAEMKPSKSPKKL